MTPRVIAGERKSQKCSGVIFESYGVSGENRAARGKSPCVTRLRTSKESRKSKYEVKIEFDTISDKFLGDETSISSSLYALRKSTVSRWNAK